MAELDMRPDGDAVDTEAPNALEQAKAMGYNPDYDGDGKVTPEEFIARKPLYDTKRKLTRRIRDLELTVTKQREVSTKLLEVQKEELLSKLQQQKNDAIQASDTAKVTEVDKKIVETTQKFDADSAAQKAPAVDPEYQNFLDTNSWYEENADMAAWANGASQQYVQKNPGKTRKEILDHLATTVKKVFPNKFSAEEPKVTDVEGSVGGGRPRKTSVELGWDDIPKDYRTIAIEQWKSGAFKDSKGTMLPKKEAMKIYAQELKKIGEIE